tara:strand:+ start:302 stop:643 length:342 start_codon:yes stop_codon:yes gene_type:complete
MIIKYLSFLLGLIWSYSFIRTQSIFSNKTALLFKLFISKVSWITFILACYFGYKNFSIKSTLIGIVIAIAIVHTMFYFSGKYLESKFGENKLKKMKIFLEYALVLFIVYYVIF